MFVGIVSRYARPAWAGPQGQSAYAIVQALEIRTAKIGLAHE